MTKVRGTLQVVATPIGNLADLSPRAQEVLRAAAVIAAEDTRRTLQLLKSVGIVRPLISLYEHNEAQRVPQLLARLEAGETVALVSDAGTPVLSDPGFELVRAAARAGFTVQAIPGPSAITTALAAAGLPAQRFCFEGFLPARGAERRAALAALAHEPRTLVFFEAPHRIIATLTDLVAEFGAQRAGGGGARAHQGARDASTAARWRNSWRARRRMRISRAGRSRSSCNGAPAEQEPQAEPAELRRTVDMLLKELPPGAPPRSPRS